MTIFYMEPDADKPNDDARAVPPKSPTRHSFGDGAMPLVYRLLFWIIILDIIGLTTRVWVMVFYSIDRGYALPFADYYRLLIGYHLLVFFVACLGWFMQAVWRLMGTMALFPVAIVLSTASLHIAATQLAYLLRGIGR